MNYSCCFSICHPVQKVQTLTSIRFQKYWKWGKKENRSSFPLSPNLLSVPNSLLAVSPTSHRSVVAVSLCGGEACMCILTRAVLPSPPTTTTTSIPEHRAPAAPSCGILINKKIRIERLLKLMETDGRRCLQL